MSINKGACSESHLNQSCPFVLIEVVILKSFYHLIILAGNYFKTTFFTQLVPSSYVFLIILIPFVGASRRSPDIV